MLSLRRLSNLQHPVASSSEESDILDRAVYNISQPDIATGEVRRTRSSAEVKEEGDFSSTDVVVVHSQQQIMVEDSRKRGRSLRGSGTPPGAATRNGHKVATAAGAKTGQDTFAAFASKYRDVLGDADADEAEAVYSMVALTQAKALGWGQAQQAAKTGGPEGRPVKRQQVAVPACSEGGSSDSSAKSAPSPGQPGAAAAVANMYPGVMTSGLQPALVGPAAADAATGAANNMLNNCSMPMSAGFFPGLGMLGMGNPAGAGGCPMPPFMPPWAIPPMMFPGMFANMGMFGPVPPGSPPLMPMPGPVMMPGMPSMPPAFMPGVPVSSCMPTPGAGEPAAGFPVGGPVPAAGVSMRNGKATGGTAAAGTAAGNRTVGTKANEQKVQAKPLKQPATHVAHGHGPQQQQLQEAVDKTVASPNSSVTAAAGGGGTASKQQALAADITAAAKPSSTLPAAVVTDIHLELLQLDIGTLKPWVLSHFCEDVYLLLLDVWRPDSPKVRDAIWAWKLHVKAPRPGDSQPDYRAFLVSLFGLEKLLQLTAAVKQGAAAGVVPSPAALVVPAPVAGPLPAGAGSGDSALDNVSVLATGSRMLNTLVPAGSGTVVGSATYPHVPGFTVQPQPA